MTPFDITQMAIVQRRIENMMNAFLEGVPECEADRFIGCLILGPGEFSWFSTSVMDRLGPLSTFDPDAVEYSVPIKLREAREYIQRIDKIVEEMRG